MTNYKKLKPSSCTLLVDFFDIKRSKEKDTNGKYKYIMDIFMDENNIDTNYEIKAENKGEAKNKIVKDIIKKLKDVYF